MPLKSGDILPNLVILIRYFVSTKYAIFSHLVKTQLGIIKVQPVKGEAFSETDLSSIFHVWNAISWVVTSEAGSLNFWTRRYDIQPNDTWHSDNQHNVLNCDAQHESNNTQYDIFCYAYCHCAEWCYDEYH